MNGSGYREVMRVSARERGDLFLATANRLGTPIQNVEKDFWVCWTLHALYERLPVAARDCCSKAAHLYRRRMH